jgi:hypothetical protein
MAKQYNLGGLTQVADNGMNQPDDDGALYYMTFDSVKDFADYYKKVWGDTIKGASDSAEYAARLYDDSYYMTRGVPREENIASYQAGIENGMDNLPGDRYDWAEVDVPLYEPTEDRGSIAGRRFGKFTIPTTDPVLTRGFMPGAGRSGFMPISYSAGNTSNVINVGGITVNGANATADEIGRSVGDQLMTRLQHSADFFRMGAANTSILV